MGPAGRPSVVDVAFPSGAGVIPDASSRAKAIQRLRLGDIAFRWLTKGAAIGVLIILGGVLFSLIEGSLPALQAFGIDFRYWVYTSDASVTGFTRVFPLRAAIGHEF